MKRRRRVFQAVLIAAFLYLLAAGVLVWSGIRDRVGKADVALVLGNQVFPDGTPSPRLKARLDTAAEYYGKGYYPKIIVSGGTGVEGVPEGTYMKKYLVSCGIPESAILVDHRGDDTRSSAVNTAVIMRDGGMTSVFVITQYFHIPRSRLALSKQGVSAVFSAHARYFEARDIYSILREVPACIRYLAAKPGAVRAGANPS